MLDYLFYLNNRIDSSKKLFRDKVIESHVKCYSFNNDNKFVETIHYFKLFFLFEKMN